MKIVFTAKETEWDSMMDPRFGRTEFILMFNEKEDEFTFTDNRDVANEAHGAGPRTAQKLFELNPDVLITGNGPGGNAAAVLEKSGMKIFVGAGQMTVRETFEAYKKGGLERF